MSEVRTIDSQTGGQKGVKPERYDLIPWEAVDEISRVYSFGATKYADHNWRKGYRWSYSLAALLRHVTRWAMGQNRDPESGLSHLAHAAWHCLTLITYQAQGLGRDDRYRRSDETLSLDVDVDVDTEPCLPTLRSKGSP